MGKTEQAKKKMASRLSSQPAPWRFSAGSGMGPSRAPARTPMRLHTLAIGVSLSVLAVMTLLSAQTPGFPSVPGNNLFSAGGSGSPYGSLIGLLTVGLAALSFAVAVLYMVANLLRQPEWEALLKTELYQIGVSVLWGVFILGAAVVADGFASRIAGGHNLFDPAQAYLSRVICLSSATTIKLEGLKVGAQYLAAMKSVFYAGAWGQVVPTFPGFEVIERAFDLIQTLIMPFASSLFVQSLGLQIIQGTALLFLLPVGVLLRIAPVTREAGSFLIAAAFGLYFILPLTYIIDAQVMDQLYYGQFGHAMCSGSGGAGAYYVGSGQMYDSMAAQLLPNLKEDIIGNNGFTTQLSYVALQAVFLPALGMVLVVSFIRSATKFFSQKLE
ncbi:MAG: hypothetical protein KGH63_02350 [Candidatus Micrarchaeota archaeon]|nr:hypothetical protein [Candidatus Micrarchaeota archaeon]